MSKTIAVQQSTARDVALMRNGAYQTGKANVQSDYIWDRNAITGTTVPNVGYVFFRSPRSQPYGATPGDTKTLIETSMEDNGKLPQGQNFLVNAINISMISKLITATSGAYTEQVDRVLQAYKLLLQHMVVEIKFSNIEYSWRANGTLFIPPIFEPGMATPTAATAQPMNVGDFNHHGWINVPSRIAVSEQANFNVSLTVLSGLAATSAALNQAVQYLASTPVTAEIQVMLRGTLSRAV
jgi:hypothetical protein